MPPGERYAHQGRGIWEEGRNGPRRTTHRRRRSRHDRGSPCRPRGVARAVAALASDRREPAVRVCDRVREESPDGDAARRERPGPGARPRRGAAGPCGRRLRSPAGVGAFRACSGQLRRQSESRRATTRPGRAASCGAPRDDAARRGGDPGGRRRHRCRSAGDGDRDSACDAGRAGPAPWRNRTSLNRLKAGCSTDELRGRKG